jgi:hypothetical protein
MGNLMTERIQRLLPAKGKVRGPGEYNQPLHFSVVPAILLSCGQPYLPQCECIVEIGRIQPGKLVP